MVDLLNTVEILNSKHVPLVSFTEQFDTSNANGKLAFNILLVLAQWEREIIKERQKAGIALAKANGIYKGRTPKELPDFIDLYNKWKDKEHTGMTVAEASRLLGVNRSTFYRKVEEHEGKKVKSAEVVACGS